MDVGLGPLYCISSFALVGFLAPSTSLISFLHFLSPQLDTGKTFQAVMRFDTDVELTYFHNGGILNYMIRKMAK